MNEYSNDIQIGFRWADAPAFRFEGLARERARMAAHEVTATFDIVVAERALTRDLPAQPVLTFIWNLSLTLNALRRGAAQILDMPVEGTKSTLGLERRYDELRLTLSSPRGHTHSASLPFAEFMVLLLRRIRELRPTLDRMPHSDTKLAFTERIRHCELLLSRDMAAGSIPALRTAELCFSTSSTTQNGERIETTLAPDPWEVRYRPPARWFGELSVANDRNPKVTVAGRVIEYLQTVMDSTEAQDSRSNARRVGIAVDTEQEASGVMRELFDSTDGRRILLEHVAELARGLSHHPGGPSAPSLLRWARDAQEQAVTLLSSVDISFEERRREITQIVSEPSNSTGAPVTKTLESRPFAARNLRRLRLEREWALNLSEPGKLIHVGADSRGLLLGFQRSVRRVDLDDAAAATILRSAPGDTLSYERQEAAVRVQSGGRFWSFHTRHARLCPWPSALKGHPSVWWRHLSDGTLVAIDEREGALHRKRQLTASDSYEAERGFVALAADSDSCLVQSAEGRVKLISLSDGETEWLVTKDLGDVSHVALHLAFVVLVVSRERGHKVVWLDRQTGIASWSSDLPAGDVQIHSTELGPLVTSASEAHGLHAIRLDARTGAPGLFGRFDLSGPVLDISAEGEHLFVRTAQSVLCTALRGRLREPQWVLTHHQSIPPDQVRWAISDDVIAILGDQLTLVAAETGRKMFEVPAFWEELVHVSIDEELHLVVVERREGDEFTVHRLHCRGFLAPVD